VKDLKAQNHELRIQLEDAVTYAEKKTLELDKLQMECEERCRKLQDERIGESDIVVKMRQQRGKQIPHLYCKIELSSNSILKLIISRFSIPKKDLK